MGLISTGKQAFMTALQRLNNLVPTSATHAEARSRARGRLPHRNPGGGHPQEGAEEQDAPCMSSLHI